MGAGRGRRERGKDEMRWREGERGRGEGRDWMKERQKGERMGRREGGRAALSSSHCQWAMNLSGGLSEAFTSCPAFLPKMYHNERNKNIHQKRKKEEKRSCKNIYYSTVHSRKTF